MLQPPDTRNSRSVMELMDKFLSHLSLELGYSDLTVEAYDRDLRQWADFSTDGKPDTLDVASVTRTDLRQYVAHLASEGNTPATIKRKVSALRSFFRFLMRERIVESNPAARVVLPKMSKNLPVYVRTEETESILDNDSPADDFAAVRDHLILDLLYSTGMRCSELIGLRDADVDTSRCELKVLGKRNKERVIPFGRELACAIDSYRVLRDSSPQTSVSARDLSSPLLVRSNGEPLYRKLVYNVVHRMLVEGGAHAARLSPHVMRHSMATDMLNSGAPLPTVQQLLGHASLSSTQVYTHVTYRDLKHNYQLAHPRAQNQKGGHYGH